jgi:hypothetical protein
MFVIENQLVFLLLAFAAGCAVVAVLLRGRADDRVWKLADLVWVLLGGFGALGAILAGVYKADSSAVERRIDLAYAATAAFDRDTSRFRLRYCEAPEGELILQLCEKADFLAASTAENADLPLFISITQDVAPLQSLNFFAGSDADMMERARSVDPTEFLVFAPRDAQTREALDRLRPAAPEVAADFTILADSYDALITQVTKLKEEWEYLQSRSFILLIQILSICLVSFAAPIRLGKSIAELRKR